MVDSAAHLVDEVLPKRPIRQWVLSVPYPLRYLFATNPKVMSQVLTIVHRVISTFLIKRARMTVKSGAQSGAVTLIQRFGSALNLNPHFHMLYLNGVYDAKDYFWPVKPPTCDDLIGNKGGSLLRSPMICFKRYKEEGLSWLIWSVLVFNQVTRN